MRVLLLLAGVLALPAFAPAQNAPQVPASASAAYIGRPIVAVRIEIEGRPTSDATLEDLVETRVGEPLSMAAVRESISHLFSLGRFQDVQVDATDSAGGVQIVYNLIPVHPLHSVAFRGNLGVSKSQLEDALASRFGAPVLGRAPEVARFLEQQFYRDEGFLSASVPGSGVEEHDPDRPVLTFDIEAGPRAVIGSVTVDGDPIAPRDAFLRRIGAVPGASYRPLRITGKLDEYALELRRRGRYEATAAMRVKVSEDRTVVSLVVDVQPGPVVTLRFEGDPLPADRLDDFVPIQREASVHPDLIEDSEVRIRNYLAQEGYWKASATSRTESSDGQSSIVFTVRRGLQYRVAGGPEVRGNRSIAIAELEPLLLRLGAGDVFVESNLEAARGAIEATYRVRGFAQASVAASASESNPTAEGLGQVTPIITVNEGPRTLIGEVSFEGNSYLTAERLRALVGTRPGDAYYAPRLSADREAVLLEYLNEGFASADVQVAPALSADSTAASLVFRIAEGPQTLVDHILIVGNRRTREAVIRNELLLRPGEPLGLADLTESRRRLSALGLFRRVQISELSHGASARHDVLVTVEEAPATTISYGGGVEAARRLREAAPGGDAEERIEFAPRGFFDIGRRNVGGKNRSINLYTRSSLRQGKVTADDPDPGIGFSEYRVVGTYREPRPFGFAGDLIVTGALEQGVRTSFNFVRKGVTGELVRRLSPRVRVSGRYSFSTTRTFDETLTEEEQATIDRIFPQVRLSSFSGAISHDTRNDIVEPSSGMFLSAEGSVAARALGGQVGFVKSYGQALWFRSVPGRSGLVFAARAALGLADGFPSTIREVDENGQVTERTIEDLPASERFFAGGDTTIRGFKLDSVGTDATINDRGFPRGGNAVLVLNGELRVPVWKSFGAAVFVDGGNVFERFGDFDLGNLRGAAGFGLRYRSPIGPIRLDLGFNMDRRLVGGRLEKRMEPHFSIGHVF